MTYPLATNTHELVEEFHKHWHDMPNHEPYSTWDGVYWRGFKVVKSPNDMLLYAMLIHELQPKCIVETGTAFGGSALFFAEMGHCPVITIDNVPYRKEWPNHAGIYYMHSKSSTDPAIVSEISYYLNSHGIYRGPILISLDSDHNAPHVLEELMSFERFARYIVVEDTNLGHPIPRVNYADGTPYEAVDAFLKGYVGWEEDTARSQRFLFSANRWLKRVDK